MKSYREIADELSMHKPIMARVGDPYYLIAFGSETLETIITGLLRLAVLDAAEGLEDRDS